SARPKRKPPKRSAKRTAKRSSGLTSKVADYEAMLGATKIGPCRRCLRYMRKKATSPKRGPIMPVLLARKFQGWSWQGPLATAQYRNAGGRHAGRASRGPA